MNIKAIENYIFQEGAELSYPELSAMLNVLTDEINTAKEGQTIEQKWAGIDLRVKVYNMFEDMKKSMTKEEIEQEETAKKARQADAKQYMEMLKNA